MIGLEAPKSGPCPTRAPHSRIAAPPAMMDIPNARTTHTNLQNMSSKTYLSCRKDGWNASWRIEEVFTT
jgi:hypothetical protein